MVPRETFLADQQWGGASGPWFSCPCSGFPVWGFSWRTGQGDWALRVCILSLENAESNVGKWRVLVETSWLTVPGLARHVAVTRMWRASPVSMAQAWQCWELTPQKMLCGLSERCSKLRL